MAAASSKRKLRRRAPRRSNRGESFASCRAGRSPRTGKVRRLQRPDGDSRRTRGNARVLFGRPRFRKRVPRSALRTATHGRGTRARAPPRVSSDGAMPEKKRVSEVLGGPKTIAVQSPAFAPGARIPRQHTTDGEGVSPPLTWLNVPREAKALALLVEDPDASTPQPLVHWVAYNIPAGAEGLPAGIPLGDRPGRPAGMRQGSSGSETLGWVGC